MIRLFAPRPAKSPRYFSADWFDGHIPTWEKLLAAFKGRPGIAALEIGTHEGRSACWLLENVLTGPGARLVCIDPFRGKATPLDGAPPVRLDRFLANVAPWRDRVRALVGPSALMLRRLEGAFDIVYVDGWHSAQAVLADAVLLWPLVKHGGVVIFDDYLWADAPEPLARPKPGIDAFLACYEGQYEIVHRAYQIALRKTAY